MGLGADTERHDRGDTMAKFLKVRNWDRWQSYRSDRGQPPWIKLHRSLLKDWDFMSLSDSERGQLMCLWILAAERNGLVPDDELALRKLLLTSDSIPLAKFLSLQFLEKTTKRRRQPDASLASQLSEDKNRTPPIVPPTGDVQPVNGKTFKGQAEQVIALLNSRVGKTFQTCHPNGKLTAGGERVVALLKLGYAERDFRIVIARKCGEWGTDDKMCKYLTPDTLFRPSNFAKYRGESVTREVPTNGAA